jgi:hypothetical protein
MPDCLSCTGWVRRKLKSKEFLTALDIPMDSQDSALIQSKIFQQDLLFRNPIGVLRHVGAKFNSMLGDVDQSDAMSEKPVLVAAPISSQRISNAGNYGGLLNAGEAGGSNFDPASKQKFFSVDHDNLRKKRMSEALK